MQVNSFILCSIHLLIYLHKQTSPLEHHLCAWPGTFRGPGPSSRVSPDLMAVLFHPLSAIVPRLEFKARFHPGPQPT